uniref:Metalloprotease TIKI homolog n=1 Tax=Globodera rostochiensis TaxID=31243 RepID=A0A914HQ06_GLORO
MYLKWLLFGAIMVNLVKTEDEEDEHVYLWKITHPKLTKPSYLFGILYLPWKILFRHFPSNVENIIKNVDVVVMDVNSESDEKSKMALLNKELPQHIIERMEKVFRIEPTDLREVGLEDCHSEVLLPNDVYEKSKIALFEQMLDVLESEKKTGTNTLKTLVESYKNGKITEQSFENHIFGLTMPPEKENELKIAKELLWAVNGANNKKWILKMNEWMKEQKPKKWIQRMNEWMMELNTENTEEKSFFFAVGLGTLITEHDSLIELLTNEGYKVEKMNGTISSDATKEEAFDDDEKDNQQPEDLNGPYFLFI